MSRTVGIDLGGTKLLSLAIDYAGTISGEKRIPTPEHEDALLDAFVAAVDSHRDDGPIDAVGLGVPGLVDRDGCLRMAPNIPAVHHFQIKSLLEPRIGVPVQVDNDATCAAWAESETGAGKGSSDVIVITL